jgi:hypothetical protein
MIKILFAILALATLAIPTADRALAYSTCTTTCFGNTCTTHCYWGDREGGFGQGFGPSFHLIHADFLGDHIDNLDAKDRAFAASLLEQESRCGKQIFWVRKLAHRASGAEAAPAAVPVGDVSGIIDLFATASKKLRFPDPAQLSWHGRHHLRPVRLTGTEKWHKAMQNTQRSLWITADRWFHQVIQSFENPRLGLGRGLLSATLPANPLAAPHDPGPEVRQAAAYGAARDSGGPRNRGNSATASSARFTRGEQAPVSLVEERLECIEAGLDGILVNHSTRLDVKSHDSLRLFRIRSLRFCRASSLFLRLACSGSGPNWAILVDPMLRLNREHVPILATVHALVPEGQAERNMRDVMQGTRTSNSLDCRFPSCPARRW